MNNNRSTVLTALASPFILLLALVVAVPLLLSEEDCGIPMSAGATSDSISVMTWNICASSCADWDTRSREAMQQIGMASSDVVAVQEGGWGESKRTPTFEGMKRLGYATPHEKGPFIGRYVFYNPAKFAVVRAGSFSLGGHYGMAWVRLKVKADGVEVVVVSTHLDYPKSADSTRERQMREGLAKLKDETAGTPTIWPGDYNSNKSRDDDAPARVMKETGRVDAVDIAAQKRGDDVNSARDRDVNAEIQRDGNQTDHIYVDEGITVSAWQQIVNADASGERYRAPFMSDHNPIVAVVGIPRPAGEDLEPSAAQVSSADEPGAVGKWSAAQVKNAAIIAAVGEKMNIPERGRVIAIMTAMGESSLTVLDRGDAAGPDSRGLFQQRDSWGSLAERMDSAASAGLFYAALQRVEGWAEMEPTLAAHEVQVNADPYHYDRFWDEAVTVYAAVEGKNLNLVGSAIAPECVGEDMNQASYLSGVDCDFPGYDNPLSCTQALAKAADIARTSACTSNLSGGTWRRWCLAFVAQAYGHQFAGYPTARDMYEDMKARGLISTSKTIPAGALVFFDSSDPADHVALYAGNGQAFSNDYIRSGCIDLTPMDRMGSGGRFLGWSPPAFPGS